MIKFELRIHVLRIASTFEDVVRHEINPSPPPIVVELSLPELPRAGDTIRAGCHGVAAVDDALVFAGVDWTERGPVVHARAKELP